MHASAKFRLTQPRRLMLLGLCALTALALTATPAEAAKRKKKKAPATGQAEPKQAGKAKFYRGSEETVSERERRLYRECQGRPNAGACAGYAR
jgi:hypothetical protein